MSADSYDAELEALRNAITAQQTDRNLRAGPASEPQVTYEEPELVAALRDLKDHLVQLAEGADDIIGEHPAASVGAAFLLGLAIGRLMRGL